MAVNPSDTRVLTRVRKLSGSDRLRLQRSLGAMGHHLVEAGIRRTHPDWDNTRVAAALRERIIRSREHYTAAPKSPAAPERYAQR